MVMPRGDINKESYFIPDDPKNPITGFVGPVKKVGPFTIGNSNPKKKFVGPVKKTSGRSGAIARRMANLNNRD